MHVNVSRAGVLGLCLLGVLIAGCGGSGSSDGGGGSSSSSSSDSSSSSNSSSSSSTGGAGTASDHVTFQHDAGRTGLYPDETVLTPQNVNSTSFGLLRKLTVDGKVDAQPLCLSQLTVAGAVHNVVYVATEQDSVYAFDADTGAPLWQVSLLASGETPSDNRSCNQVTPVIGVTATPVIDRARGEIFVVAMSKDAKGGYHQRLHALDLTTGGEAAGAAEISATYLGPNGSTTFDPGQYEERAALLLSGGTIYTSWTSHCDIVPYGGWIIAYSESTLAQTGALNVAASSDAGPAIWMSGDGPAADANGDVYLLTANGGFETVLDSKGFPQAGDFGNAILRISMSGGQLYVRDYFSPKNTVSLSNGDEDLGSGGEILLPDVKDASGATRHLVVGAGKDGHIFLADRDNMGGFNAAANNIYQERSDLLGTAVFSTPAYFNGTLYYCGISFPCRAYPLVNALLGNVSSTAPENLTYPGATPSVSADGTANGIVWAHENTSPAVLHAYDATNLANELYNSNEAGTRDQFGAGNKYIAPVIADGKVFVGGQSVVAVFGLR